MRQDYSPSSANTSTDVDCADLSAGSLRDHFLIAMPELSDSLFNRAVIYICEHSADGAMGIVINQPMDICVSEIFAQLELPTRSTHAAQQILAGGPVQTERGFVLHDGESDHWESSIRISDSVCLTTSRDILTDLACRRGPSHAMLALGYAGWGPGQLEDEIIDNAWLTAPGDADILFHTPAEMRWSAASKQLGVNLDLISTGCGHA